VRKNNSANPLKVFQDAATVVGDFANVAAYFDDIPQALVTAASDVATAVYARSLLALIKVRIDLEAVWANVTLDKTNAQSAIDTLKTDLDALVADLGG
jgi:hypothetical protein